MPKSPFKAKSVATGKTLTDLDRLINDLEEVDTEAVQYYNDKLKSMREWFNQPENKDKSISSADFQNIASNFLEYFAKIIKQIGAENLENTIRITCLTDEIKEKDEELRKKDEDIQKMDDRAGELMKELEFVDTLEAKHFSQIKELEELVESLKEDEAHVIKEILDELRKNKEEQKSDRADRLQIKTLLNDMRQEFEQRENRIRATIVTELDERIEIIKKSLITEMKQIEEEKCEKIKQGTKEVQKVLNKEIKQSLNENMTKLEDWREQLGENHKELLMNSVNDLRKTLEKIDMGKEEIGEKVTKELKDLFKNQTQTEKLSYAEVIKTTKAGSSERVKSQVTSILIKSKDSKMEPPKLEILKKININENKIKINRVREVRGGVVAELPTNEDVEKLREKLMETEETKNLEIEKKTQNKPQIIIKNVEGNILEEELTQGIKQNNEILSDMDLKVDLKLVTKRGAHYVFTLDPDKFKEVMGQGFLYYGWFRYEVGEFVSVRQCSKCGRLGHTRGRCQAQTNCLSCGGSVDHDSSKCNRQCVLCSDFNKKSGAKSSTDHTCKSQICPIYLRAKETAKKYINYN